MPHISIASSIFFLLIIFIYSIVFVFTIFITNINASYTKLQLNDSVYQNDDSQFGYFAQFYRNEVKITKDGIIPKYNEGVEYVITTCTYQEIQLSENKSCGNLTGIDNTESIIDNINRINRISNIIWIILGSLILINILITVSVYKLILKSTSNQIGELDLKFKFKKRRFLFKYFRLSFVPLVIPTGILITYYNQFNNYFTIIIASNGASMSNGGSFGFAIISIVFNCIAIVCTTIFYLIEYLNPSLAKNNINKPYITPNGENTPIITKA
ncbi:hypothetical protein ACTFIU_006357 [Dictyostelium citrinum]